MQRVISTDDMRVTFYAIKWGDSSEMDNEEDEEGGKDKSGEVSIGWHEKPI